MHEVAMLGTTRDMDYCWICVSYAYLLVNISSNSIGKGYQHRISFMYSIPYAFSICFNYDHISSCDRVSSCTDVKLICYTRMLLHLFPSVLRCGD